MKLHNIFNLGILVVLGFGSLSAHTSKSYPLSELSYPLGLSSCTNSTYPDQQYKLVNSKVPISGEAQYSQTSSLITVNNGELLISCSDRSEASEKELPSVQWAGLRQVRRSIPSFGRVRSISGEAYKHKYHIPSTELVDRYYKIPTSSESYRIFSGSYEYGKIPSFLNEDTRANENIRAIISGSDEHRKTPGLLNQERRLREIASLKAQMRIDQ